MSPADDEDDGRDGREDREAILSRRRMLVAAALAGLATAGCDACEPASPSVCLEAQIELIPMPPQLPPPPPEPPPPPPVMVTPEPQQAEPPAPQKRIKRRPRPPPPRTCLSVMPTVCLSYIQWHDDDDD